MTRDFTASLQISNDYLLEPQGQNLPAAILFWFGFLCFFAVPPAALQIYSSHQRKSSPCSWLVRQSLYLSLSHENIEHRLVSKKTNPKSVMSALAFTKETRIESWCFCCSKYWSIWTLTDVSTFRIINALTRLHCH